jgi:hypothetical protein
VNLVDEVRLICLLTNRTKCCACIFSGECYLSSLIVCLPHVAGQENRTDICRYEGTRPHCRCANQREGGRECGR